MKKTVKNGVSFVGLPAAKKPTKKQQLCIECKKCCTKVGVYTDPAIYELSEKDVIHFYKARGAAVTRSDNHYLSYSTCPVPTWRRTAVTSTRRDPKSAGSIPDRKSSARNVYGRYYLKRMTSGRKERHARGRLNDRKKRTSLH